MYIAHVKLHHRAPRKKLATSSCILRQDDKPEGACSSGIGRRRYV